MRGSNERNETKRDRQTEEKEATARERQRLIPANKREKES